MFEYKERLGPWGMIVRIEAHLTLPPIAPARADRVGQKTWLRTPDHLSPKDAEWLEFAAKLAAEELEHAHKTAGAIFISVTSFEIPMVTDYQEEAASVVLIRWLRSIDEIKDTNVTVTFDRNKNLYRFSFHGFASPK